MSILKKTKKTIQEIFHLINFNKNGLWIKEELALEKKELYLPNIENLI